MKIGIYDPYLDSLGGGERYMLTIAECLADAHDVSVFWDNKAILEKAKQKLGINTAKIRVTKNIFSSQTPFLQKLLATQKYDVIFFLSDGSLPISLSKKTFVHFQFPVEWVTGNTFANKLKLSKITKVFCNSQFTKKFIDKKFGINSLVVYPPCLYSEDPEEEGKDKKKYILTVGRYNALPDGSSFKRHEFLIATFKEMVDKGLKNWELIIATSSLPEHEKQIEAIAKTASGYPIKVLKNISFLELKEIYQQSQIYWHAAGFNIEVMKHPELVEHFGMTTVEAMHAGSVPVVINKGGQKEIITDGENGFLWDTKEELIAKTKKLINDDGLRKQLAKRAMQRAKEFSVEKFCAHVTRLITNL